MDVPRRRHRLAQAFNRKIRAGAQIKDDFFAPGNEIDFLRQELYTMGGNDDGTMIICVNDIIVCGLHAKHVYCFAKVDNMNVGMAGANAASEDLEILGRGGEVAK